jgi:hypothetical protein
VGPWAYSTIYGPGRLFVKARAGPGLSTTGFMEEEEEEEEKEEEEEDYFGQATSVLVFLDRHAAMNKDLRRSTPRILSYYLIRKADDVVVTTSTGSSSQGPPRL